MQRKPRTPGGCPGGGRRSIFAVDLPVTFLAAVAVLPALAAAPADDAVTFNASLTSDYRYRGISQTRLRPALQGGADYVREPDGLYAGTWLSTIRWTKDAGGTGGVEWDAYAGKRGRLGAAVQYDAGLLAYAYPGFREANTVEAYGQLAYGAAYVKYSLALTNLFGIADSRRSGYLDIGANVGLGSGSTLNLHAGRQDVRRNGPSRYTDYKVGITRDLGAASLALAFVGTNAGRAAYASPRDGSFLGRKALVASIATTF